MSRQAPTRGPAPSAAAARARRAWHACVLLALSSLPARGQQPPEPAPPTAQPGQGAMRTVREQVLGLGARTVEVPVPACRPVREDTNATQQQYQVPRPPFSQKVFPCTRCHDRPDDFNPKQRNLTLFHTQIKLAHGPREQWCYGCHNPTDRDRLRLASGRLIEFDESYELCGQCHGEKLRDWRLGIHGRRTGCWNGEKEYRLCVHCHDPHAPRFAPLAPKPRPRKPEEIGEPNAKGDER